VEEDSEVAVVEEALVAEVEVEDDSDVVVMGGGICNTTIDLFSTFISRVVRGLIKVNQTWQVLLVKLIRHHISLCFFFYPIHVECYY